MQLSSPTIDSSRTAQANAAVGSPASSGVKAYATELSNRAADAVLSLDDKGIYAFSGLRVASGKISSEKTSPYGPQVIYLGPETKLRPDLLQRGLNIDGIDATPEELTKFIPAFIEAADANWMKVLAWTQATSAPDSAGRHHYRPILCCKILVAKILGHR